MKTMAVLPIAICLVFVLSASDAHAYLTLHDGQGYTYYCEYAGWYDVQDREFNVFVYPGYAKGLMWYNQRYSSFAIVIFEDYNYYGWSVLGHYVGFPSPAYKTGNTGTFLETHVGLGTYSDAHRESKSIPEIPDPCRK